ncbi:hypothetical protein NDR89_19810 [Cupriavidus gilardii]|uniref:Uncharacterized protein n=1 Tax=Cupriavidus gilardii TaxID=82541 RepID=A0ABY4W3Z8_9BURK|nr:hypothetical protein [Cupriavidus gilardii]USE81750.1 hypothetical protein NDR89_19810 [Cupriavidus gilardii]
MVAQRDGRDRLDQLPRQAYLAGWPTPNATLVDAKPNPPITSGRKPTDPQIGLADVAVHLAGWQTPTSIDSRRGDYQYDQGDKSKPRPSNQGLARMCGPARLTATGELLTGSSAEMESGGQLSPAHSRWLMGLPRAWGEAAPIGVPPPASKAKATAPASSKATATRSTRKRRLPGSSA